jgi:hypothetical protein
VEEAVALEVVVAACGTAEAAAMKPTATPALKNILNCADVGYRENQSSGTREAYLIQHCLHSHNQRLGGHDVYSL